MVANTLQFIGKTALATLLVVSSAQAGDKLTWFGEASFSGAYPQSSQPQDSVPGSQLLEQQLNLDSVFSSADLDDSYIRRIKSEIGLAFGQEAVSVPVYYRRGRDESNSNQQPDGFGIKWRHNMEGAGSLTMMARYGKGENSLGDESSLDTANRLASVSWASGVDTSGVTGSFYIGDEQLNKAEYADSARMIYGFAVGGHWLLGDTHTPYVSLRYQDSDQAAISGLTDYEKYTRISAGWNWQVKSNWRVRAEANFTYDQPRLNLLDIDRTRFQFTTRFDIK